MTLHRKAEVLNIESMSAQELINTIIDVCDDNNIDIEDCTLSINGSNIQITSSTTYWPDEY